MHHQRIAAAYDSIAEKYAASDDQMPPALIARCRDFLSSLKSSARILDAGCGAGRDMAWMESQGFHVIGIDLSTGMLAQARKIVKGELIHMDFSHLTFPASSFDAIWCNASLLHIPKSQMSDTLTQMHNLLIPGGHLYLGLQEGEGEQWQVTRFGVERFFARYSPPEIEAILSQTGFAIQHFHHDTTGPQSWLNILTSRAK